MANYLLPMEGSIPNGIDCASIANTVYQLLRTREAIHDLSLPDPNQWIPPTPSIILKFSQAESWLKIPNSRTVGNEEEPITCYIFYLPSYLSCLPLLVGIVTRELTHAIRNAIVRDYNRFVEENSSEMEYFPSRTPPMPVQRRMIKHDGLYQMNKVKFLGGHWVEHTLYGGVAIALYGSYCFKKDDGEFTDPVDISNEEGLFFKIHHEVDYFVFVRDRHYQMQVGYLYDAKAGQFCKELTTIYSDGGPCRRDND